MDISAIGAALGSLKAAKDLAADLIASRTSTEVSNAVNELLGQLTQVYRQLLEAQATHAAMLSRVHELEAELTRLRDFHADAEQYELKQLGPGAFAYAKKPFTEGKEPQHYLCANCYQQAVKAILQLAERKFHMDAYACPRCTAQILVPNDLQMTIEVAPRRRTFEDY